MTVTKCQGIVAEKRAATDWRIIVDESGDRILDADGQVQRDITWTVTPAHPCEAEATMLSRSMQEVVTAETQRDDGSTVQMLAWERVGDTFYCAGCFVPGTMTHADGSVSRHPTMAVSDA